MRIDVTRQEFDVILDSLDGSITKSQHKTRDELFKRLKFQLKGGPPSKNGYAPIRIRSSWPSGHVRPDRKSNWSFHKPRNKKVVQENLPATKSSTRKLTADEILAGL